MENIVRLSIAAGIFAVMVTWEAFSPRRSQQINRKRRWPVNLGLAFSNMVVMRFTIGSLAFLSAEWAAEKGYGLLNLGALPNVMTMIATLLILDFAIYCQHIVMHKWPLMWRLHKVHHADLEFDATTAVRFHPLEIVLSMIYKVICIVIIGANPMAVIAFEIILNGAATFNHSNVNIPQKIDRMLRWIMVTPDMHRIHHSAEPIETDSNYGFSLSWWDRLCGTYIAEPKQPQTTLTIGLNAFRKQEDVGFVQCLLIPFKINANRSVR
ncbi:MAG: sterol desaturase family protein [Methylococcaceae bacterium]|nr:sterol desaturase family protein [Methylococcaceae bacterium]